MLDLRGGSCAVPHSLNDRPKSRLGERGGTNPTGEHNARSAKECEPETDRSRGGRRLWKSHRNPCKQRTISHRRVSPLWGRVWGYPNQGDFLQRQVEFPSERTTSLRSERQRE